MSYVVQDCGPCPMLVHGHGLRLVNQILLVDEADLAVVAQFLGDPEFSRPYADRIAHLLNTHGAVDDAELTSITDQGETT